MEIDKSASPKSPETQAKHTEGHMLLMMKLMIEKHMTFSAAHEVAMKQVGR